MRQWQLRALGEPAEQLELVEVDEPRPDPGTVLVDVEAVGVGFPDVLQCRGRYQVPTGPGHVPGGEISGTVVDVGDGVDHLRPGDRVVGLGGGLRERAVLAASMAVKVPPGVDPVAAAALPVNYGTTWFALHERAALQPGEWLLVTGAAGGTGTSAIHLGKAAGAAVIAVAGGSRKVDLCRAEGADEIIDHTELPQWVDRVREISGGGVDVAYDPVGGDTFHQVRRTMAWDGRLLVIGFVAGIPEAPMNHVLLKNYSIVGVHWGASLGRRPGSFRRQMEAVLALVADGAFTPVVCGPYPFGEAPRALQDVAERRTYGKVVVTVDH